MGARLRPLTAGGGIPLNRKSPGEKFFTLSRKGMKKEKYSYIAIVLDIDSG